MSMNDAQSNTPVNPYLKTKVMTASPEELRLMLYEGAIKFCRQATDAIGKGDWEAMYNALIRAQKIVLELEEGGVLVRERVGRRNHYTIQEGRALRHPVEGHRRVKDLLDMVRKGK